MYFKQFYLGCPAHPSHLFCSGADAPVADPRRAAFPSVADAEAHGLKIRSVVDTHLPTDLASGPWLLAARTWPARAATRRR